jgi:hypothetical protein
VSAYQLALDRMQAEVIRRINEEAWAILLALANAPPAHPPKCRTCGDTGLVEALHPVEDRRVFATCSDCPTEPFPLP